MISWCDPSETVPTLSHAVPATTSTFVNPNQHGGVKSRDFTHKLCLCTITLLCDALNHLMGTTHFLVQSSIVLTVVPNTSNNSTGWISPVSQNLSRYLLTVLSLTESSHEILVALTFLAVCSQTILHLRSREYGLGIKFSLPLTVNSK